MQHLMHKGLCGQLPPDEGILPSLTEGTIADIFADARVVIELAEATCLQSCSTIDAPLRVAHRVLAVMMSLLSGTCSPIPDAGFQLAASLTVASRSRGGSLG